MTDIEALKARVAEIDEMIDAAPGWGAYVGALIEERRGLVRAIATKEASQ